MVIILSHPRGEMRRPSKNFVTPPKNSADPSGGVLIDRAPKRAARKKLIDGAGAVHSVAEEKPLGASMDGCV